MQGLTTHVIEQQPQPLTEQLLSRVPELSKEGLGQQLLKLFRSKGLTNSSGLLVQDPRHSHWHDVVKSSKVAGEGGGRMERDSHSSFSVRLSVCLSVCLVSGDEACWVTVACCSSSETAVTL